ncbi:hypothetical protein AGMMS49965_22320 [Bacteroidia bacterium]|nr:hypothetical protein AGMMS49965_22320 [Bacteroidia bacterium]
MVAYIIRFHNNTCGEPSAWGEFGSFYGGVLSPLVGILSICLLYITLKKQNEFNKIQQTASDLDIMFKLQEMLQSSSDKIQFSISKNNKDVSYTGLENIANLKDSEIDESEFNGLYDKVGAIANLCLLHNERNYKSTISENSKLKFYEITNIFITNASIFFPFCQKKPPINEYEFKLKNESYRGVKDKMITDKERKTDAFLNTLREASSLQRRL